MNLCLITGISLTISAIFTILSAIFAVLSFKDYILGYKNKQALLTGLMGVSSFIFNSWFVYIIYTRQITNYASYSFYSSVVAFVFFAVYAVTLNVPLKERTSRQLYTVIYFMLIILIMSYTSIAYPSNSKNQDNIILTFNEKGQYLSAIKFIFYNPKILNFKFSVILRLVYYLVMTTVMLKFYSISDNEKEIFESKIGICLISGIVLFVSAVEVFFPLLGHSEIISGFLYCCPTFLKLIMFRLLYIYWRYNNITQDLKTQIKTNTIITLGLIFESKESENLKLKKTEVYLNEQMPTLKNLNITTNDILKKLPRKQINRSDRVKIKKLLIQSFN